jgi:hypothetical protein
VRNRPYLTIPMLAILLVSSMCSVSAEQICLSARTVPRKKNTQKKVRLITSAVADGASCKNGSVTVGGSGVIGAVGDAGLRGEQGEVGAQGLRGDQGIQGDVGEIGDQGAVGQVGQKGDTGAVGVAGLGAFLRSGTLQSFASAGDSYFDISGTPTTATNENVTGTVIPIALTYCSLEIQLMNGAPNDGSTRTFTLRKQVALPNSSDAGLTCSIPATASACTTAGTVSYMAGNTMRFKLNQTTPTAVPVRFTLICTG